MHNRPTTRPVYRKNLYVYLYFVAQVFDDMCNQLHITPNNAQATFVTIVNELFSDGIKWGRIVALFAFSGALAVQCVQKEMPLLVEQVVDWTVAYIEGHLMSWIVQNGDWVCYCRLIQKTYFAVLFHLFI